MTDEAIEDPYTTRRELLTAKQALAERERKVHADLEADRVAVEAGREPSQPEAWSIGDAYTRLLDGMNLDGDELVEFAERQVDELFLEVGRQPTPRELRGLVLSSVCIMAMLWQKRLPNFTFEGLSADKLREGLDYARERGWGG